MGARADVIHPAFGGTFGGPTLRTFWDTGGCASGRPDRRIGRGVTATRDRAVAADDHRQHTLVQRTGDGDGHRPGDAHHSGEVPGPRRQLVHRDTSCRRSPRSSTTTPRPRNRSMNPVARSAAGARSCPAWWVPALLATPIIATSRVPTAANASSRAAAQGPSWNRAVSASVAARAWPGWVARRGTRRIEALVPAGVASGPPVAGPPGDQPAVAETAHRDAVGDPTRG
jgi:hypothetical protein